MDGNAPRVEGRVPDTTKQKKPATGPGRRRKATAELEREVLRLRERGLTSGQIHRRIGGALSVSVILRLCARAGLVPPRPRRAGRGPVETVRNGVPLRRFTAEEDARLAAMAAAGARDQAIAAALGRRQSSIADRRRLLARRMAVPVLVIGPGAGRGPRAATVARALDAATDGRTRSIAVPGVAAASVEAVEAARFLLLAGDWFDQMMALIRRHGLDVREKCVVLAGVEEAAVILLFSLWRLSPASLEL